MGERGAVVLLTSGLPVLRWRPPLRRRSSTCRWCCRFCSVGDRQGATKAPVREEEEEEDEAVEEDPGEEREGTSGRREIGNAPATPPSMDFPLHSKKFFGFPSFCILVESRNNWGIIRAARRPTLRLTIHSIDQSQNIFLKIGILYFK